MASVISRQSAADAFNNNVRGKVTWNYSKSNLPPVWGGYNSGVNASLFGDNPGWMGAGNVSGGIITASTFITNVRDWIYNNISQVRTIRVVHKNVGDNENWNGDNWYRAVCNTNYRQGINLTNLGISSNSTINTNIAWNNAYNAWNAVAGNGAFTITNTIHVSHSNHSNHHDHGSRVRR